VCPWRRASEPGLRSRLLDLALCSLHGRHVTVVPPHGTAGDPPSGAVSHLSSGTKPPERLLGGAVSPARACGWGSCLCCRREHADLGGAVCLLAVSPAPSAVSWQREKYVKGPDPFSFSGQ